MRIKVSELRNLLSQVEHLTPEATIEVETGILRAWPDEKGDWWVNPLGNNPVKMNTESVAHQYLDLYKFFEIQNRLG